MIKVKQETWRQVDSSRIKHVPPHLVKSAARKKEVLDQWETTGTSPLTHIHTYTLEGAPANTWMEPGGAGQPAPSLCKAVFFLSLLLLLDSPLVTWFTVLYYLGAVIHLQHTEDRYSFVRSRRRKTQVTEAQNSRAQTLLLLPKHTAVEINSLPLFYLPIVPLKWSLMQGYFPPLAHPLNLLHLFDLKCAHLFT